MRRFVVTALLAGVVLAGCKVCNDLFYVPTLSFTLSQTAADQLTAAPSEVGTCLNGTCWTNAVDATGNALTDVHFDSASRKLAVSQLIHDGGTVTAVNGQTDSTVSLTVSRDGGTVFTREWKGVAFEAFEPNGEGCGVAYKLKDTLSF